MRTLHEHFAIVCALVFMIGALAGSAASTAAAPNAAHESASDSATNEIPSLKPPMGEVPANFLEKNALWLSLGAIVLGASALLLAIRVKSRLKTIQEDPVLVAKRELQRLAGLPETGPTLSAASRTVKSYIAITFKLSAEELTTPEFIAELNRNEELPEELRQEAGGFLKDCDALKFAPESQATAQPMVPRALELVDLAALFASRQTAPNAEVRAR